MVRVLPGGPAASAGLLEGDIVTTVDGASVTELSVRGVFIAILNRQPGSKVKIGVMRGAKTISADVTLGNVPHE